MPPKIITFQFAGGQLLIHLGQFKYAQHLIVLGNMQQYFGQGWWTGQGVRRRRGSRIRLV